MNFFPLKYDFVGCGNNILEPKQTKIGKKYGNFRLKTNEAKEYEHIAVNLIDNNDFIYSLVEI